MSANSIQSQVLDAVVAATGGAAASVFRCQTETFSTQQLPADNVLPLSEEASYEVSDAADLVHRFQVRHTAAAANGVDVLADARYVRSAKLLLADPTLGGLVTFTRYISRKWEMEGKGEQDLMALVVTYEVEFSTARNDPSARAY